MNYQNPIIRGFNPDPSICRVGEDFYLVTSSFEYFPGIPVYHSRDLVNWRQVGNCIERKEQLPLDKAKASGGIWAPTIRYYEGIFYVTATFDGMGNFIISSDNPATGWSNPVWVDFTGIDPSIMFENGEMYYCANDIGERNRMFGCEGISLAKVNPRTGSIIGKIERIWTGTGGGWLEAPHVYHVGEYYYILAAEGGTGANHMVVCGRSKDIWGPYESCPVNPILTNRSDTTKQIACCGHADMFEDGRGNWWAVHLGTRPFQGVSSMGRETFLVPVAWENGWPVMGKDKRSALKMEGPLISEQTVFTGKRYDFETEVSEPEWLYRRLPKTDNYLRGDGGLILKPSTVKLSEPTGSPTLIMLRQPDKSFTTELECEFITHRNGDRAGLVVYLSEKFFYSISKLRDKDKDYIVVERQSGDLDVIVYKEEISKGTLKLSIMSDGEYYYFYYESGNKDKKFAAKASVKFISCEIAGKCFTGTLVGAFSECVDEITSAFMKIKSFELRL